MATTETISPALANELERVENAAWGDFCRAAPPDVVKACGLHVESIGEALVTIAAHVDVLGLNRVIGLGSLAPADTDTIGRIVKQYADAGVPRMFIQVNPITTSAEFRELLQAHGLRHYNNWVKLHRDTSPLPPVETDLEVREVGAEHAADFGRIVAESFGWQAEVAGWAGAIVGRDGWHCYMAFDGDTPVATGAFFVSGKSAWIDFAATLADYRGRGAQAALLEARLRDAAALGCERLVVETAEQTSEKSAPSFRNMIRYGFKEAFVRPNYIWTR